MFLKDIFEKQGIAVSDNASEQNEEDVKLHRNKKVVERPTEKVLLNRIYNEVHEYVKTQLDPTEDLIEIPVGEIDLYAFESFIKEDITGGYLIFDKNTLQTWYASSDTCLNKNFIYREDLVIEQVNSTDEAYDLFMTKFGGQHPAGVISRKSCYILDNPANETYEIFYETAYTSRVYGQTIPKGCFVHKYVNRFHRDMAILELDKLYSDSSRKMAEKLTKKQLKNNEAIIISDGAWMKDSSSCAFIYIDSTSLIKFTEGAIPSEVEQAVLISEIRGAYNALSLCKIKHKKKIKYYYDNTSIFNVFKNRKTEYIDEIKSYKALLEEMNDSGYSIEFIEVHPKTGEDRTKENKAIQFFHNICDSECRNMSDIFRREYKDYVATDSKEGQSFSQFKEQNKPKGKPNYNKSSNNQKGNSYGNNSYGKQGNKPYGKY